MNIKNALSDRVLLSGVLALLLIVLAAALAVVPASAAALPPTSASSSAVQSVPTKKIAGYCSTKSSWKEGRALQACIEDLNGVVGARADLYKKSVDTAKVQKAKVVFKFQHLWDGTSWETDRKFVKHVKKAVNKNRKVTRRAEEYIYHGPGVFTRVVVTFKYKIAGKWHKITRATPVVALNRDWGMT